MRLRLGAALLPAFFLALTSPVRADLNDGKPCFTYINPPGNGVRYVCTSTSHHTLEHPTPETFNGKAWRTRITARREGEPTIYDLTFDSLVAPLEDPFVQEALSDATRLVRGPGYAAAAPALLAVSTEQVEGRTLRPAIRTLTVTPVVLSSSSAPRTACVGELGDLAQPPPPLPAAPCPDGATTVSLRTFDGSISTSLDDRLEDTHTHVRTDTHDALVFTGDLTTSHYEIVATPALPCSTSKQPSSPGFFFFGTQYGCTSESGHTTSHASSHSMETAAWSTRVTGRLRGGAVLFDETIHTTLAPDLDDAVRRALVQASAAVASAARPGAPIEGPALVSSSAGPVTGASLPGGSVVALLPSLLQTSSTFDPRGVCVGALGDLERPPSTLPQSPCRTGSWTLNLIPYFVGLFSLARDDVRSTHTHTQRDVYAGLYVTGTLTTTHFEYVAELSTSTLVVPIVLSPSGGSSFTSELTLANFASTDAQASFAYTPAFGGTTGTVTDSLPAAMQRVIPDAVAYLKNLGLTNPGAGGTLRMTFSGSATPNVYAAVRTTAAVPEGRVGLAYPALPPSKLLSSAVFLHGLRQNSLDRSNVAVLNAGAQGDGDVTLRLTVTSGDPANPQSKVFPDIALSPGAFSQISSILVSNGLALSNGYVKAERVSGTAPYYAYAVVNDQATADGSFIEPVAASPAAPISSTTLPVVVETPSYSTELVLTNFSATTRTLNFIWVAPALSGGKATFSLNLLPGEQQILPGLVQLLRDRGAVTDTRGPSFAGALFVSDSTGDLRGVAISTRILSALGGGRAGVALPSYGSGSESNAPVWLCGLQQNATTRSNLALVHTGSVDSSPSSFRIDLYDGANGNKTASVDSTVPAKGFVQIDRILAIYAPGIAQGCALVTRTSGGNPFLAYAVLNDGEKPGQRSGDGAYVVSVPASP